MHRYGAVAHNPALRFSTSSTYTFRSKKRLAFHFRNESRLGSKPTTPSMLHKSSHHLSFLHLIACIGAITPWEITSVICQRRVRVHPFNAWVYRVRIDSRLKSRAGTLAANMMSSSAGVRPFVSGRQANVMMMQPAIQPAKMRYVFGPRLPLSRDQPQAMDISFRK